MLIGIQTEKLKSCWIKGPNYQAANCWARLEKNDVVDGTGFTL